MSRKKWRFAPTEVKRAINLVRQAGLPVSEVAIEADGTIRVLTAPPGTKSHDSGLDEWMGKRSDAGQTQGHQ